MQYPLSLVIKIILAMFLVIIFEYGALNYSGFCFKEMRYLSDEEKIQITLNSIIKEQTTSGRVANVFGGNGIKSLREIITYKSAEAFILENPDCCKELVPSNGFFAEDEGPTFLDRVLGRYSYGVRVSYVEKRVETPINKDGTEGKEERRDMRIHGFLPYGNCGQPCDTCGD